MRVHFPSDDSGSGKQSGHGRRGWLLLLAGLAFLAAVVFFAAPLMMPSMNAPGSGWRDSISLQSGTASNWYNERHGTLARDPVGNCPLELAKSTEIAGDASTGTRATAGAAEIRSAGPNGKYGDHDDIFQDVTSGRIR